MAQRCFGALRSTVDEERAYKIGFVTISALVDGHKSEMVALSDNNIDYYTIALSDVGGKEKKVPVEFYDVTTKQVTKDFIDWLVPITGEFKDNYLSLDDIN